MLEVKLLGQFEVILDGSRLNIPSRNAQSLFAYLLLNAGKSYRRERLAGLLWPDSSEENARSNLRHELWRMRKALEIKGESFFIIDDLTIGFNTQSEYSLDVNRLESTPLGSSLADDLSSALIVYQGELLPGFYDEWVLTERERVHALFEAKVAHLLELLQTEGRWAEVLDWGRRWIAFGGWPEPAYRSLISAYANTGDISKAVATYERYAQSVQKDLGMKPSEQTQVLYKRLKAGWKPPTQVPAPSGLTQQPKTMVTNVTPTFIPPRIRRSNLLKPLTSFIGREKEIQQVESLVCNARIVTITGPGGVGKTRLAIQVAEGLTPQFKDGVWWVELASLFETTPSKESDPSHKLNNRIKQEESGTLMKVDLVAQVIAKVLRIPERPGLSQLEGIFEQLHDKQLLLIIDNCEHLIEACAVLVESLLGDCPEMTILATSREPLGAPGEKTWALSPLSLPGRGLSMDFMNIIQSEAVSLFIERAGDILPNYKPDHVEVSTIAQICLRLDGIPLAIELAAARMNLLSTQEIAVRLASRFSLLTDGHRTALPRHQTLRAAIEWSHDLLEENERVLFRRLAVFPGTFTMEAVEAICASQEIRSDEVLFLIGRLVSKSMVTVLVSSQDSDMPTRYRMLDTIRSFGLLKLEEVDETRWLRDRHAEYFVHLVETTSPKLHLRDQVHWYRLLQAENDNLHAVVEWSTESDQAEGALRLVGALWFFWWSQSSSREGCDLVLKALKIPSAVLYQDFRTRALSTAGCLQWVLGDIVAARQSLEAALSILNSSDDKTSLARTKQFMGLVYTYEREYDLADAAFKEGQAISSELGDVHANNFLFFQGDIYLQKGDRSRAQKIYEENAIILREIGNKVYAAYPLRRLGYLALEQNDISKAWDYFRESLIINRDVSDERAVCACLTSLAALAIHLDKPIVAARLYGAVESQLESLSINLFFQDQAELGRIRSQLQTSLDGPTFTAAFTEGWGMSKGQTIELVDKIIGGEEGQALGKGPLSSL